MKNMRFRILIALFLTFIVSTCGFDLQCKVRNGNMVFMSTLDYCHVPSLQITTPNETITSVNGQPIPTELQGILIYLQPVAYLPKGIGKFFPKLKALTVEDCGLKSIDAADLENLGELENIQLFNNSIEELASDLFKFTPKLQHINFGANKIRAVGKDLLKNFTSLETHFFNNNTCIKCEPYANLSTVLDQLKRCPEVTTAEVKCKDSERYCEVEHLMVDHRATKLLMQMDGEKIEYLIISNQNVLFVPFKLSETLPELRQIVVKNSKLSALHQTDFEGLVWLDDITIENNNIPLIEQGAFDEVPQITTLNLANNSIMALPPRVFTKLTKLTTLNLSGNKLQKFTASFLPLKPVIRYFNLQKNELEILDSKVITLLKRANQIDLSDNECIDIEYRKMIPSSRSLRDIFNDIKFQCSDDSEEDS